MRSSVIVGNVNAAGADQEGLAPRAVEAGNIGGESDDRCRQIEERGKMNCGSKQDFAGFSILCAAAMRVTAWREWKRDHRQDGT